MDYYFPSCKFTGLFPAIAEKAKAYARSRGMTVTGCCRTEQGKRLKGDRAYYACTNCGLILRETSGAEVQSLLGHISRDGKFLFPDLRGRNFVVQHCAKADAGTKETVCGLISRMGAEYTVGPESGYCGTNFMQHMAARNMTAAPRTFSELEKRVVLLDKVQQEEKLRKMMEQYSCSEVITYCNSCYETLKLHGVRVFHLLELLLTEYVDGAVAEHE